MLPPPVTKAAPVVSTRVPLPAMSGALSLVPLKKFHSARLLPAAAVVIQGVALVAPLPP